MKKDQVKLGGIYLAKVSSQIAKVRLDAENPHGGWDATNLATNKKVRIKSAQRLRGPAAEKAPILSGREALNAIKGKAAKPAATKVTATIPIGGGFAVDVVEPVTPAPTDAPAAETPKAQAKKTKEKKALSGLDAAAQVLAEAGEPLNTKTMVERMLAKGLWSTNGKTPAATLYSAIIREIDQKPGESRFKKTDRGLFTLATPKSA